MNTVGASLSLWWGVPMAGILLSMALVPLFAKHFWERRFGWIGAIWAAAFVIPAGFELGWGFTCAEVAHVLVLHWLPFVLLIGTLFVISGGVMITGPFRGTPRSNAALLVAGTLCASAIGTTGASMLFLRPILRANQHRKHRVHTIVFFIFLVSNVGGSLTPLGDPPLFLGFLRGVPFFWTTSHLLGPTLLLTGGLLALHVALDVWYARREAGGATPGAPRVEGPARVRVEGGFNLVLLVAVAAVIMASGAFDGHPWFVEGGAPRAVHLGSLHVPVMSLLRDAALVALAAASLWRTPRALRETNQFLWAPLEEVAILFFSIFVTMTPVIWMLRAGVDGAFAPLVARVREPLDYFWTTGTISAFLDNAPSYVVFFEIAHTTPMSEWASRGAWGAVDPVDPMLVDMPSSILMAISAGAVFLGAMTYIGNGPNFMVRSIAERAGVPMPSFFGFTLKWAVPFLLPLLALMAWLFLSV